MAVLSVRLYVCHIYDPCATTAKRNIKMYGLSLLEQLA